MSRNKMIISFLLVIVAAVFFLLPDSDKYYKNEGLIFGTTYTIQYQASKDLHPEIRQALLDMDSTFSLFNPASLLSRLNRNETDQTNEDFETVFNLSRKISRATNGAFDITVAPLVNAWGFGLKNKDNVTPEMIDSLLPLVGYSKVALFDHQLFKEDPNIQLDLGAVAKGYACDHIAKLFEKHHVDNYLIEIGGEIVARGHKADNSLWAIGITRPQDDPTGQSKDVQTVIHTDSLAMATSGNYRNFYYYNGQRRSHTIDPRTGYPVKHNLLSATVVAPKCALADAIATSCMVLGPTISLKFIEIFPNVECLLCVADNDPNNQSGIKVLTSSGWDALFGNQD